MRREGEQTPLHQAPEPPPLNCCNLPVTGRLQHFRPFRPCGLMKWWWREFSCVLFTVVRRRLWPGSRTGVTRWVWLFLTQKPLTPSPISTFWHFLELFFALCGTWACLCVGLLWIVSASEISGFSFRLDSFLKSHSDRSFKESLMLEARSEELNKLPLGIRLKRLSGWFLYISHTSWLKRFDNQDFTRQRNTCKWFSSLEMLLKGSKVFFF